MSKLSCCGIACSAHLVAIVRKTTTGREQRESLPKMEEKKSIIMSEAISGIEHHDFVCNS
jgi:hypothetical protein